MWPEWLTEKRADGSTIQDDLITVLENSGLTDECENPDVFYHSTLPQGEYILYCDGGDAFAPAVVFYHREHDRVHVPPAEQNVLLWRGEGSRRVAYLAKIADRPEAWYSLAEAVADTALAGTARSTLDEDDRANEGWV